MDLFYRFVIFFMAVLLLFASMSMALYAFGLASPDRLPGLIYGLQGRWEMGILFLLLFAAGAWVIYPFFTREKTTASIKTTETGSIDITLDALDSLIKNIAIEQEGVVSLSSTLNTTDTGLQISLKTEIYPSMSIPQITQSLQELVKTYIEETTGVSVTEVRILVEKISKLNDNIIK
ncbi:MAG: alkaline shock response membrane anchor protein AmaP [Halanaerobiaceae bacterium]|jgi:uncharacterized alkaline shock family protein YloU|nr:alkaline shock response membrane anchor protein AmaP [Halanaerobiaceae bacterium]